MFQRLNCKISAFKLRLKNTNCNTCLCMSSYVFELKFSGDLEPIRWSGRVLLQGLDILGHHLLKYNLPQLFNVGSYLAWPWWGIKASGLSIKSSTYCANRPTVDWTANHRFRDLITAGKGDKDAIRDWLSVSSTWIGSNHFCQPVAKHRKIHHSWAIWRSKKRLLKNWL